jgi:hypothetical protein
LQKLQNNGIVKNIIEKRSFPIQKGRIIVSIPKPITARQMKKLASLVTGAIPSDLSSELAQYAFPRYSDTESVFLR